MKLFNVFVKKNSQNQIEDIVFLKDGFSFMAFAFSNLWFLYHKMWREFLVISAVNVIFVYFDSLYFQMDKILLEIGLLVIIGFNARYWLATTLKARGYEFSGMVFGCNLAEAKLRFVKEAEHDVVFVN